MMYSMPHYYHSSQNAYGHRKTLVKQEPVDVFDTETIMDTGSVDAECQPHTHVNISLDNDSTSCENVQFRRSYVPAHHRISEHRNSHTVVKQHIPYSHSPSFDDLPSASSAPTSNMDDFQINFSRIKRIPEIMTTSGRNFDPETVDLSIIAANQRARREFVPDEKKDNSYWSKRLKNNDSARRSRVKRKALEKILETRLLELEKENLELKHEVASLRRRYGEGNGSFSSPSSALHPEHIPLSSTPLPSSSQENANSEVVVDDCDSGAFCIRDNSRRQSCGPYIPTNLNSKLGTHSAGSIDSIKNDPQIAIKTFSNSHQHSGSFNDGSIISEPQMDLTGALDLTVENSNRSTPSWESSSSESDNNSCFRRYTFISSESSSQEENNSAGNIKIFPLKCRWKKEMHATYTTVPQRLK